MAGQVGLRNYGLSTKDRQVALIYLTYWGFKLNFGQESGSDKAAQV
jgi:hypothetical protein